MIALICRIAKALPRHLWRPPPNAMNENCFLSSSRPGPKRSGSKRSGSRNSSGSRCDTHGDVHSHVVLNTDVPTTSLDLLHLVAHEVYPGHHTEHAVKERLLGIEERIQLVPTPQAVLSEGIAEGNASIRNMHPTPATRLLFGSHGFCEHGTHHAFPVIPYYNLPEATRQLGETVEAAHRIEIIVEDGNTHDATSLEAAELYFTASNSTSNISVAFGGITPPAPRAP